LQSAAKVLVNTVNTDGVMGKGIARDFKAIYPEMFTQYRHFCETGQLTVGKLWLYKTPRKWVLNFPTKTTWKKPSKVEYVEAGLKAFAAGYSKRAISSVAFPPLGCGNGELDWEKQIRPLMEQYLKKIPIDIFVHFHKPDIFRPEHHNIVEIKQWLNAEPQNLPLSEVWGDLVEYIGTGKTVLAANVFASDDCINIAEQQITKDILLEAWSILRNYGFLSADNMPGDLSPIASEVVELFSKLDYCKSVQIDSTYSELNKGTAKGVRLMRKEQYITPESDAIALNT